jgi:hypothetical protein
MPHAPREDNEPWYKQFWPWFLISLPATAVIGSMISIKLAVDTADGLVIDDYYKEGLAINKDITKEKLAKTLGLAANIDIDNETGQLHLLLLGKLSDPPKRLKMSLIHPTKSGFDVQLQLTKSGDGEYMSRMPKIVPAKWHVSVMPENEEWKISGRMKLPAINTVRIE